MKTSENEIILVLKNAKTTRTQYDALVQEKEQDRTQKSIELDAQLNHPDILRAKHRSLYKVPCGAHKASRLHVPSVLRALAHADGHRHHAGRVAQADGAA